MKLSFLRFNVIFWGLLLIGLASIAQTDLVLKSEQRSVCPGESQKVKMFYKTRVPYYSYYNPNVPDHFYSKTMDIRVDYNFENAYFSVSKIQLPGMVKICRFWDENNHLFTTSETELGYTQEKDHNGNYYDEGYVYPANYEGLSEVQDYIPIYRHVRKTGRPDRYFTLTNGELDNYNIENGGKPVFYAFPLNSEVDLWPAGTDMLYGNDKVPVYLYIKRRDNDFLLTQNPANENLGEYSNFGIIWYSDRIQKPGSVNLHRYRVGDHHYYSDNLDLINKTIRETANSSYEGPVSYIYLKPPFANYEENGNLTKFYQYSGEFYYSEIGRNHTHYGFSKDPAPNNVARFRHTFGSPIQKTGFTFYVSERSYRIDLSEGSTHPGPEIELNSPLTVTLNSAVGRASDASQFKPALSKDILMVSASPSKVCKGETVRLSVNGVGTFIWKGPNNFLSQASTVDILPQETAVYSLYKNISGTETFQQSITIEVADLPSQKNGLDYPTRPLTKSRIAKDAEILNTPPVTSQALNTFSHIVSLTYSPTLTDLESKADWHDYTVDYKLEFYNSDNILVDEVPDQKLTLSWNKSAPSVMEAAKKYDLNNFVSIASYPIVKLVVLRNPENSVQVPSEVRLSLASRGFTNTPKLIDVPSLYLNPDNKSLAWKPVDGAANYDLEWVYIDQYDQDESGATVDFTTNPAAAFSYKAGTRVNVADSYYEFLPTYPSGKIFFRVRAVACNCLGINKPGEWTYLDDANTVVYLDIPENSTTNFQSKSWQSVTTFAEEGKYKKVVNYFDGSSRSRQSLTTLSSEKSTVMQQTFYDYEGRPSVTTLPTAFPVTNVSTALNYVPGISMPKANFDNKSETKPYDQGYYSSLNAYSIVRGQDNFDEFKNYIPSAEGYPFSQTIFTADNSGKVLKQSIPGLQFRIAKGLDNPHFTRHYYLTPLDFELKRLFGSNVGDAVRYQKDITIDANGQATIAYVDQQGRTIATAMIGNKPGNLLALADNDVKEKPLITISLNGNNEVSKENSISKSFSKIMNLNPDQQYSFYYDLTGVFNRGSGKFEKICKECTYKLTVKIISPDGTVLRSAEEIIKPDQTSSTSCPDNYEKNLTWSSVSMSNVIFNEVGEYTIIKELTLNSGTIDEEILLALTSPTNPDRPNKEEILKKYNDRIDLSKCAMDCEESKKIEVRRQNPSLTESEVQVEAKRRCEELIGDISETDCEYIKRRMIQQVSPGGYYNDPKTSNWLDENYGNIEFSRFSMFRPTSIDQVRDPVLFKSSWAARMIKEHPEYKHYATCTTYIESNTYDKKMARVQTHAEAETKGLYITTNDPFLSTAAGATFQTRLQSFRLKPDETPMPLSEYVRKPSIHSANVTLSLPSIQDREWRLYKALYLGLKEELKQANNTHPYLDATSAHTIVRAPDLSLKDLSLNDQDEVNKSKIYANCAQLCPDRAIVQANQLEAVDAVDAESRKWDEEKKVKVIAELVKHCENNCGVVNPYGLISGEDVASGKLDAVKALLINPGSINQILTVIPCGESITYNKLSPFNKSAAAYMQLLDDVFKKINAACTTGSNTCVQDAAGYPFNPRKRTNFKVTELPSYEANKALIDPRLEVIALTFPVPVDFLEIDYLTRHSIPNQKDLDFEVFAPSADLGFKYGYYKLIPSEKDLPFGGPSTHDILNKIIGISNLRADKDNIHYTFDLESKDGSVIVLPTYFYNRPEARLRFGGQRVIEPQLINPTDPLLPRELTFCINPDMSAFEAPPVEELLATEKARCVLAQKREAEYLAEKEYEEEVKKYKSEYLAGHFNKCFEDPLAENFYYETREPNEYQYTLYYYDQAGNLVKTVPPEGVKPVASSAFANKGKWNGTEPSHTRATLYKYNSLEQVTWQKSPDGFTKNGANEVAGNVTTFFYNEKGQLRLSQSSRQQTSLSGKYSYTNYDPQGRVEEVGELNGLSYTAEVLADLSTNEKYKPVMSMLNDNNLGSQTVSKSQITRTQYDVPQGSPLIGQENLRNRVSSSEYVANTTSGSNKTFYSYDIHGNVKALVHDLVGLGAKKVEYEYDLISGKVNSVHYQKDQPDQYAHRYNYDGDNRLKKVETSKDGVLWNTDAKYFYYKHGPLARVELGQYKVQGLDYFYTLQGWLKGINIPSNRVLNAGGKYQVGIDPGRDGFKDDLNPNMFIAEDRFAYGLHYYTGDYTPLGANINLGALTQTTFAQAPLKDGILGSGLYNGNIAFTAGQVYGIMDYKDPNMAVAEKEKFSMRGSAYQYDQLNRLITAKSFFNFNNTAWQVAPTTTNKATFSASYTYDRNGNISNNTTNRTGGDQILLYDYKTGTNQLTRVARKDEKGDFPNSDYTYDGSGNLITDNGSNITGIQWNAYGKIEQVSKGSPFLQFGYDASGNRTYKKFLANNEETWYVRDAQGNILATYNKQGENTTAVEYSIYGSSRLGKEDRLLTPIDDTKGYQRLVGIKSYELSNHLGNVMAVVSDLRLGHAYNGGARADYYTSILRSASDYYPFGEQIGLRSYSPTSYRYGFNGEERDDEGMGGGGTTYDYGFRIYNPQIAKFLSVDPLTSSYPWYTPYQFAGNNPVRYIDLDGLEEADPQKEANKKNGNTAISKSTSRSIIINISISAGVQAELDIGFFGGELAFSSVELGSLTLEKSLDKANSSFDISYDFIGKNGKAQVSHSVGIEVLSKLGFEYSFEGKTAESGGYDNEQFTATVGTGVVDYIMSENLSTRQKSETDVVGEDFGFGLGLVIEGSMYYSETTNYNSTPTAGKSTSTKDPRADTNNSQKHTSSSEKTTSNSNNNQSGGGKKRR